MSALLELRGIEVAYGRAPALHSVSFTARPGEITALLGANGAGKTTTMLAVSGLLRLIRGDILLDGESIGRLRNDQRVARGLVQIPQGRQIFPRMTVLENIKLGAFLRSGPRAEADLDRVLDHFPKLRTRLRQLAGTLSGGEQQMLAIARALMAAPKVLLLDEPSLGLAPVIVDAVYEIIGRLRTDGLTIVLAEQNVGMALEVAAHVCVLQSGRVAVEGSTEEMASSDFIERAYLG